MDPLPDITSPFCCSASFFSRRSPALPFNITPKSTIRIPTIIKVSTSAGGSPSSIKGSKEPTNIIVPMKMEKPKESPIWFMALLHIMTPMPQRKLVSPILIQISMGMFAKISVKPSIRPIEAIMGTTNMVNKKKRLQVFSYLNPLVNFSGRAYRPNINPAKTANNTPSVII